MTISSQLATPSSPIFSNIKVQLKGVDGNIFVIISIINKALKTMAYQA